MDLLFITMVAICGTALWYRRAAVRCPWEGAPTLTAACMMVASYLTSPYASAFMGKWLHDLTGLWNFEDFLGHIAALAGAVTAVYMFLVRFGDPAAVQRLYPVRVVRPVLTIIPLLLACRILGTSDDLYFAYFDDLHPGPWTTAYWLMLLGALLVLFVCAGAILLHLRAGHEPCNAASSRGSHRSCLLVIDLYLITISAGLLFLLLEFLLIFTSLQVRPVAWSVGYVCVMGWAIAPAYSWHIKTRLARRISMAQLREPEPSRERDDSA